MLSKTISKLLPCHIFSEEPDSIVDMLLDQEKIYLKVDTGSKTVIDAWAMNVDDEVQPGKGNEEDEIFAEDVAEVVPTETHVPEA